MIAKKDRFDETVVTSIEKIKPPQDIKAYILFISGPLKGEKFLLSKSEIIIGRDTSVDIKIEDSRVSRQHLKLIQADNGVELEDLGSTNGTFVNGRRIKKNDKYLLKSNDKIHISSDTLFRFAYGDEVERMFEDERNRMAYYDAVTEVYNKHFFNDRLKDEFNFAKRSNIPLSLLMMDIDFFKKVNDTYGHMAGDFVLHQVAQTASKTLRSEDILARYGGEEFVVILRNSNIENAQALAERIRIAIETQIFIFEKKRIKITISIGGVALDAEKIETPEKLIEAADKNLYKSKHEGRNRITVG
ncbi:MAG: GGDEF domain-containing protein [Pseudomonadota bacterium]